MGLLRRCSPPPSPPLPLLRLPRVCGAVRRSFPHHHHQGYGGGIYADSSTITMNNCVISGNTAGFVSRLGCRSDAPRRSLVHFDGLASRCSPPSPPFPCFLFALAACVVRCSFLHHHHQGGGGGIYADSSTITMKNCVISGNTVTGYVSRLGCRSDAPRRSLVHFDGLASRCSPPSPQLSLLFVCACCII
jgi:hypothetical protein